MKTTLVTVVLMLTMLAGSSAQAFCFLKNNSRERQNDYYQYRVPAAHVMQRQARYYPYSNMPPPVWYDQGIPAIMPEPDGSVRQEEWRGSY